MKAVEDFWWYKNCALTREEEILFGELCLRKILMIYYHSFFFSFFFFFFFFKWFILRIFKVLCLGDDFELRLRPMPQPRHHQIQAAFVTYTEAYSNTGSLPRWARLGLERCWVLLTYWVTMGTLLILFFLDDSLNFLVFTGRLSLIFLWEQFLLWLHLVLTFLIKKC